MIIAKYMGNSIKEGIITADLLIVYKTFILSILTFLHFQTETKEYSNTRSSVRGRKQRIWDGEEDNDNYNNTVGCARFSISSLIDVLMFLVQFGNFVLLFCKYYPLCGLISESKLGVVSIAGSRDLTLRLSPFSVV